MQNNYLKKIVLCIQFSFPVNFFNRPGAALLPDGDLILE